jgi:hypothetical protein
MNAGKASTYLLAALGVGFIVGFAWGARTREELPAATDTTFAGGVLTVRVAVGQALSNSLSGLLS